MIGPASRASLRVAQSSASCSRCLLRDAQRSSARATLRPNFRALATDAAPEASASANVDPKLVGIVDQIEKLTLLEASELVTALKTRLNITDIALPAAGAAAAPAAAAPAADAAPAEAEKPKEKTVFTLKLKGLKDASAKAKVIKEVKALNSTMNLVEAKKFVESAPQTLKEGLNKEDAEKLKAAVEAAGGLVEME